MLADGALTLSSSSQQMLGPRQAPTQTLQYRGTRTDPFLTAPKVSVTYSKDCKTKAPPVS